MYEGLEDTGLPTPMLLLALRLGSPSSKTFCERFAPAIWPPSARLAGKSMLVEEILFCPSQGGDKSSPTTEISSFMGENAGGFSGS